MIFYCSDIHFATRQWRHNSLGGNSTKIFLDAFVNCCPRDSFGETVLQCLVFPNPRTRHDRLSGRLIRGLTTLIPKINRFTCPSVADGTVYGFYFLFFLIANKTAASGYDRNSGFSAKTHPDSASESQNDSRIHHGGARESRRDSSESNFDTPDSRRNARKHRCRLSGEPF